MLSFDTNILIYASDNRAGERHAAALSLLNAGAWAGAALTEQSLIEFASVVMRKHKRPLAEATGFIVSWLEIFPVLVPPQSIVDETLSLLAKHTLSVWDARLLATCAANGCETLLSEDLADKTHYGPVFVVNPFYPHNASLIERLLPP
jgi:predicted nucleic acid-binding protein